MHLLVYLRRTYSSPLPLPALVRRLEHTVVPHPAGLLWWLGIRRLPCWGEVRPTTSSFRARLPWGRSDGPIIQGHWQANAATEATWAVTIVQLTIRLPLVEMLGGSFMLALLIAVSIVGHNAILAGIAGVFGLFFIADAWWSIRRAERYFQAALALEQVVEKLA